MISTLTHWASLILVLLLYLLSLGRYHTFGSVSHYHTPLLVTHLTSLRFKCQLNWPCLTSMHRGVFSGVWRDLDLFSLVSCTQYEFFINCNYVRVLFGPCCPKYITHLINYGQNNPNGMKKNIIHFHSIDTTL